MPPSKSSPHTPQSLSAQALHILLALASRDLHGYAIMQEIEDRTDGELVLSAGTLYNALGRLLDQGLVAESDARPDPTLDDERRRYYRLTPTGREVAAAEARRLARVLGEAIRSRVVSRAAVLKALPGSGR